MIGDGLLALSGFSDFPELEGDWWRFTSIFIRPEQFQLFSFFGTHYITYSSGIGLLSIL